MTSCSEIAAQLAALREDIAELNNKFILKSERDSIVNQSVNKSEQSIIPKIPDLALAAVMPAVGIVIAQRINPLQSQIGLLDGRINAVSGVANDALSKGTNALKQFGVLAGKVAGILSTLAALAVAVAALQVLGVRLDALESFVTSLSNDLSKALGLIGENRQKINSNSETIKSVSTKADKARLTAEAAIDNSNVAIKQSNAAIQKSDKANQKAEQALQTSKEAINKSEVAAAKAENALSNAQSANKKAGTALSQSAKAENTANEAINLANTIRGLVQIAINNSVNALTKSLEAIGISNSAKSTATAANSTAENANAKSTQAIETSQEAIGVARNTQKVVEGVIVTVGKLNTRVGAIEIQIPGIQGRIRNNEVEIEKVKGEVSSLSKTVAGVQSQANANANNIGQIGGAVGTLTGEFDDFKRDTDIVNREGTDLIKRLREDIANIPPLITPIGAGVAAIPKGRDFVDKVGQGTCNTLNSSRCTASLRNGFKNDLQRSNDSLLDKFNAASNATNNAANAAQLQLLNTINSKLGKQIKGGLSGAFNALFSNSQIDRIFTIANFVTNLHNAVMLSNNAVATLGATIDAAANLVGLQIKNEEGKPQSLSNLFKTTIKNGLASVLGSGFLLFLVNTFNKANRIYQSATNMLTEVQGMFDSARQIGELTANNTGKIGNALKKAGAVYEDAYKWMSEKNTAASAKQKKWDAIIEGINEAEEKFSNLNSIVSQVQDIKESVKNLQTTREDFKKLLSDEEKSNNTQARSEDKLSELKATITQKDLVKADG